MPRHKQLELFNTKALNKEKIRPESIVFNTAHFEKLSVSATPMSFDLVLEILKPAFANSNTEETL